jgi:hypothetical protein
MATRQMIEMIEHVRRAAILSDGAELTDGQKRRRHLKRELTENPDDAHHSDFAFGRDTSTGLNGVDRDATRRRKDDSPEAQPFVD